MSQESRAKALGPKNRKRAVRALAAGAAIAAGTHAYGVPVRFDNPPPGEPGHFDWAAGPLGGSSGASRALYVHLPPQQQGSFMYFDPYGFPIRGPRSFNRTQEWLDPYYGWIASWVHAGWWGATNDANIEADSPWGNLAWGLAPGEIIPAPGAFWAADDYGGSSARVRNPATGQSLIPENVPAYLGVRIGNLSGGPGWHYGWIGVVRTGWQLQAFAWGYETDVNTPIRAGIPEPGTLAMLAFGACTALVRRR